MRIMKFVVEFLAASLILLFFLIDDGELTVLSFLSRHLDPQPDILVPQGSARQLYELVIHSVAWVLERERE